MRREAWQPTAQIGNAAGVAAIGAAFSAIEANRSAKPAFFVALALFALTIGITAAFLSSMRNAPQGLTRGQQNPGE